MRGFIIALAAGVLLPGALSAQCVGTGRDYRCTDADGVTHHVRILGPVSETTSRAPDGRGWSSRSFTSGAVTRTEGRDADGGRWEWTTRTIGRTTITTGRDPRGRSFEYRCDAFRCY